ncbi:hypothetical protein E7V67_010125 [[Empedobacter] haloabium]|uniref:DUF4177 domain-containing protein n=1 Tax=[Empedobacter] haloabium TaxID=592317 RepID=A0ABZ1USY2_9BURK
METTIAAFSCNGESLSVFGVKHSTNFKVFATIKTAFANEGWRLCGAEKYKDRRRNVLSGTGAIIFSNSLFPQASDYGAGCEDAPILSNGHYATVTCHRFKIEYAVKWIST